MNTRSLKIQAKKDANHNSRNAAKNVVDNGKSKIVDNGQVQFALIFSSHHATPTLNSHNIHFLQRTIGNRAVGRMIQAKLTVGRPDDKYEQEADRVADAVTRMPEPLVQRQEEEPEEEEAIQTKNASGKTPQTGSGLETQIRSMGGGGQPLPDSARTFFEPRFGCDFSQVRVHNDRQAAEIARTVNVQAVTIGRNVVFGKEQYSPETTSGKRLLAHELAHVVQRLPYIPRKKASPLSIQLKQGPLSPSKRITKPRRSTGKRSDPLSSYTFLQTVLNEKEKGMLRKPLKIRTRIRQLQAEMYRYAKKEAIPIYPPYGLTRAGVVEKMESHHERIRRLLVMPRPDDLKLPALRLCYRDDIAPSPSDPNHIKLAKDRIIAKLSQMKARIFVVDPYAVTDTENRLRIFLGKYEVSQTRGEVHFKDLLSISEFKSIVSEEKVAEKRREEERTRKAMEREKKRVEKVRSSEEFENLGWEEFTTDFILDYALIIKAQAKKQNIDAIAIAGVVSWEREVNWKGYWSDILYQRKQCAKGTISQTAGIGYGSIHLDIAEAIEMAGRVPAAVSIRIRCQRLQDPTWAILYSAAIMNQHAGNYQHIAGINIRNRPDILATLYNTGKSEEKAKKKKEEIDRWEQEGKHGPRPTPVPNEMGRWIHEHLNNLGYLLGM